MWGGAWTGTGVWALGSGPFIRHQGHTSDKGKGRAGGKGRVTYTLMHAEMMDTSHPATQPTNKQTNKQTNKPIMQGMQQTTHPPMHAYRPSTHTHTPHLCRYPDLDVLTVVSTRPSLPAMQWK